MSASPSAPSSGPTPNGPTPNGPTPNGRPAPSMRRRRNADPLVRPKKDRKPLPSVAAAANNKPGPQGAAKTKQPSDLPLAKLPNSAAEAAASAKNEAPSAAKDPHGFSEPPRSAERTMYFPLMTTKRSLIEGLRYHVAKLASKKHVDPTDEKTFTRPVRLYRRDPRAPPAGGGGIKDEDATGADTKDAVVLDEKDREQQDIAHQEKEAQRQADLAQIAPAAYQAAKSKRGVNKRKTQQVYRTDQTPEQQKASKLRYEEALPWHLEDFDNKNIWVGTYEAALSEVHIALIGDTSRFRLVPVEKWYKFTAKNHFKPLTIEEAELRMNQKVKEPRWFMKAKEEQRQKNEEKQNRRQGHKLFVGKLEESMGEGVGGASHRSEFADSNDLDYEEDRFADDEENQVIEGDEEEAKEAEKRIKRDQLQANVFDLKDEQEYDREEDEEKKEKELAKKLGKGVLRALRDHEKNLVYDDDTDSNPYTDDSTTEEEDETNKEGEQSKAGEKNDKTKGKEKDGSRLPSGASTKGTNTPSGRNKHSDPLKKAGATLKRPGSPNLSEASGTESARKKSKKQHGSSSALPTATGTPKPGSRPMSPAPPSSSAPEASRPAGVGPPRSSSAGAPGSVDASKTGLKNATSDKKRGRPGAGSGSDGDVTAGEMSDGAQRKKVKGTKTATMSASGSRQGSRAGSPNAPAGRAAGAPAAGQAPRSTNGSRAGSPSARAPPSHEVKFPTSAEIAATIPPGGITIGELTKLFRGRVGSTQNSARFIDMVREVSTLDKTSRKLLPKTAGGTASPKSPLPSST